MIGTPSPSLGLWDLAAGRFIRGREAIFCKDFLQLHCWHSGVLKCSDRCHLCDRLLCREWKYQMSLFQLGEVLPKLWKLLLLHRIFVWGHCSFAAIALHRFLFWMWMQVSGVKRWSAEILWNSLMWTLASANGSWNQRVKSRPSHWSSWMIELTKKERWQFFQTFLQTTFTSIDHCMINRESGSVALMIYFCHSESIRSQPKRWTGYGSGLECGDCDLTCLWSLHCSSSFHVDLCQKESLMGTRWTKNEAGHCVHTPSF